MSSTKWRKIFPEAEFGVGVRTGEPDDSGERWILLKIRGGKRNTATHAMKGAQAVILARMLLEEVERRFDEGEVA